MIGLDPIEIFNSNWQYHVPVVTLDEVTISEGPYRPAVEVVADIEQGLRALTDAVTHHAGWNREDLDAYRQQREAALRPEGAGLMPGAVIRITRERLADSGILTVDASSLKPEHYAGAGIGADIPTVVAGLETEKEFTRVMLDNLLELDVEAARAEHLAVARRLVEAHPEIGALVLECTNMPPYRADIQHLTGLPVFDIVTLVRMVHEAVKSGLPPRPA